MSERLLRNLFELTESIEKNSDSVKSHLAKPDSSEPDSAIVISAAKYHQALEMLAKE